MLVLQKKKKKTVYAFKFQGRRHFEFYDELWLPLLLFIRSYFV